MALNKMVVLSPITAKVDCIIGKVNLLVVKLIVPIPTIFILRGALFGVSQRDFTRPITKGEVQKNGL